MKAGIKMPSKMLAGRGELLSWGLTYLRLGHFRQIKTREIRGFLSVMAEVEAQFSSRLRSIQAFFS
jgi:hypothetical protein